MGGSLKDQLGRDAAQSSEHENAPAVILVTPQLGQNIGAVCRCMLNFGLTELRLVAFLLKRHRLSGLAAGAARVLDNAKLYGSTAEAVADLTYVLAATARRRELEVPVIGTGDIGANLRAMANKGTKTGILFGPEKAGLKNEDVVLADAILTYPVNPAFQSLNLAQAVNIFAYIWQSAESAAPPALFDDMGSDPAKREDLIRLFEHLEAELDLAGFFYPPEKKLLMSQNIRAPLMRAKMTEQEVRTFRGIIKVLVKGRGKARK